MIHDFMASNGSSSGELTVRRGQTVEVLERLHDKPDWCLVRTTDRSPAQEGIVPCSMLCIAHSRSSMEMEGLFNHKGRRMPPRIFIPSLFWWTGSYFLILRHIWTFQNIRKANWIYFIYENSNGGLQNLISHNSCLSHPCTYGYLKH